MKNLISKLILLTIPIFIFIIWLVMRNQAKVNHVVKTQTTQFNKQFNGFNRQFGGGVGNNTPRRQQATSHKITNNKQLNKNINAGIGNF